MDKIFIIDPGHGGMIDGQYQTAPKKMYQHENGEIAYEGVLNRLVADHVMNLMYGNGIKCINLCPTELDVPLKERVNIANIYADEYGKENVFGISLHSNAGKGTGFEIYTGPGQTVSDVGASIFVDQFKAAFHDWKIRSDYSDGDPDKEAKFYVLVYTKCAWILPEWGFFDNYQDWVIMRDPSQQKKYAEMIVNWAKMIMLKGI